MLSLVLLPNRWSFFLDVLSLGVGKWRPSLGSLANLVSEVQSMDSSLRTGTLRCSPALGFSMAGLVPSLKSNA